MAGRENVLARLQSECAWAEQKPGRDCEPRNRRARKIQRRKRQRESRPAKPARSEVCGGGSPGHSTRIRGSLANRSRSASKLPSRRKTDESITIATTTYTSRERIESTSSGPNPGQLKMISASAEALNIVA